MTGYDLQQKRCVKVLGDEFDVQNALLSLQ